MEARVKTFDELTNLELYRILQARAQVFMVEQDLPHQDLDDRDQAAIHVYLEEERKILAYARVLGPGVYHETYPALGRILTLERGQGLGLEVCRLAIQACQEAYRPQAIYINAQSYATGFYEKLGFEKISEEFIYDQLPHYAMVLNLPTT